RHRRPARRDSRRGRGDRRGHRASRRAGWFPPPSSRRPPPPPPPGGGAGGRIEHLGMPVDPGNLLLVAAARGRPVVGAPGCARSPKENGFDWVLMRLLAGLEVPRTAITGMGVGGLLMEIVTRPQPRAELPAATGRRIAAVVLAAGRSTRMGGPNKLLAEIAGRPLLRIVVEEALASRAKPVIVVVGHQRAEVEK